MIQSQQQAFWNIPLSFFKEYKAWHVMWIIGQADNSHEMPKIKIIVIIDNFCWGFTAQTQWGHVGLPNHTFTGQA